MARQPDIQYVQMYNYGNTARKLELKAPVQKKKYELPGQLPQRQREKRPVCTLLDVCSIAVAVFMLFAMVIGLLQVGVLSDRQQALQAHIETLQQERAGLQVAYEKAYDLEQVEQRARQMGLVDGSEAVHISMEAPVISEEPEPTFWDRLAETFAELFAKAP